ncbi:MAG: 2-phospho-L-lactate transferase CofD family protein, partial [Actinomycetota bacterium]|nr:2-phospho-L-lactate transferase CofD family protein [Actinomycetota bacterium]
MTADPVVGRGAGPVAGPTAGEVAVVCGGVGAARFLRALALVHPPERTVGVVNTADDTVLLGLSISPDIDTVTYRLAEASDP